MRYNFKRLGGREWVDLIRGLRRRRLAFLEVNNSDLYDKNKVNKVYNAYFYRNATSCKIIYYEITNGKYKKRLREISFSPRAADPLKCVLVFKKIANKHNECIPIEPSPVFHNGIYTYYKGKYEGQIQVWDMNSAYLWALTQPLADYSTKEECSIDDIFKKKYDYYSFENDLHRIIYYKEQLDQMQGPMFWADVKIYGYKSKIFFKKTAAELYALKQINKDFYKNVANLTVGCMHKRNGERNSATLAGSLYAYFEWFISDLVAKLKKKKYNVIMVTTDSIKLAGKYNKEDNIFPVGLGLGEFKLEYEGDSKYYSIGHYEENTVKWKGKPKYLRDGNKPCLFVSNLKQEAKIYEQYAEK